MNKKLQVFVSSTYTDLIEERQAAVQAILDAGHIPAGMELFKAGNDSQLKTIYKWIDESDVYMLILGGRYGSVESKSGKSYTQLEYEYAVNKGIPVFAVVLSNSFLTKKKKSLGAENVIEANAPDKYKEFKSLVMSRIIREVDDCKDIKLTIHSTLHEFIHDYDLTGWTRNSNENDAVALLKENHELIKENNALNKQIQKLQEQLNAKSTQQFGHYSFEELVEIFVKKEFKIPAKLAKQDEDLIVNGLRVFIANFYWFVTGVSNNYDRGEFEIHIFYEIAPYYVSFGLLEKVKISGKTVHQIQTTKAGEAFYAMLEAKGMVKKG